MTVLSAQSIRRLCNPPKVEEDGYPGSLVLAYAPLVYPFVERDVIRGKSFGLSSCTYDCRIAEDLTIHPREVALASTLEKFCFPNNVCGSVLDKSSYARLFISAFNTHLDPGWSGYLTVELANLSNNFIDFKRGDPICQIKFEWLDLPTELPYRGKYQNQEAGPQPARHEYKE